jgi:RNA polymerase sigma-70 factor (ECF subfamily)
MDAGQCVAMPIRHYRPAYLHSCGMLWVLTTLTQYKHNFHITMHSCSDTLDPAQWLEAHGDYLYRFAMQHLRDTALAEDAVQETLLAALQAKASFSGDSSPRTWLTGILKHKVIDIIRKQSRMTAYTDVVADSNDPHETPDAVLFDARGEWAVPQANWGDPETALEQERFWNAFFACLDSLPPKLAKIFSLRELSGLETAELCEVLNITSSNSWVILHRARLALKACLETTWLKQPAGGQA